MTHRKRMLSLVLVVGLLGAVGLGLTLLARLREPLLLERATRIAGVSDWDLRWTTYYWLTNQDILFFREDKSARNGWDLYRHCLADGRDVFLPALTKRADDSLEKHSDVAVAPNGRRLLWDSESALVGADLDGSHPFTLDRLHYSRFAWTADSGHVVQYGWNQNLDKVASSLISDVNAPNKPRRLFVPADSPLHLVRSYFTATGHVLIDSWSNTTEGFSHADKVEIYDVTIGAEARPAAKYTVRLPFNTEIHDVIFSPRGDRVAWELQRNDGSPVQTLMHRLLPHYQPHNAPIVSLWVSRIDGSDMHEVGCVKLKPTAADEIEDYGPEQVYWRPDGKRLSFVYKDALYTIPAD